jgi:hypothetical protein
VDRVVHDTLAVDIDLHLSQAVGLDAVVGCQIGGADYAANRHHLFLSVDLHQLRPFHHEIAVGKLARHSRCQRGIESSGSRRSSLAIQGSRTCLVERIGQCAGWALGSCQGGDRTIRTGLPGSFGGAGRHGGRVLGDHDGDQVIHLTGAQIATEISQTGRRRPERTGKVAFLNRVPLCGVFYVGVQRRVRDVLGLLFRLDGRNRQKGAQKCGNDPSLY